ncbi:NDP-sugar synthase [bacterium]|nr:NDP-sugar synthase [bacterium]
MFKESVSEKIYMTNLSIDTEAIGVALAAGLGTRLRPLTLEKPKPLIPFCGVEILQIAINKLKASGITDLGVNTHYMSDKVREFVNTELPIKAEDNGKTFLSVEKNEILGTAGCYPAFNSFRKDRALITANGDVLSTTDISELYKTHKDNGAVATMAVLDTPHSSGAQIWVDGSDIVHIGNDNGGYTGATPHGFACFQVLENDAISLIKEDEYQELVPIYQQLLKENKKVCAYVHKADWFDLGTHDDYFYAHQFVLNQLSRLDLEVEKDKFGILETLEQKGLDATFVPPGKTVTLKENISVTGPSFIIGSPVSKSTNDEIDIGPNSVIMDGVSFEGNCSISSTIVLPETLVNNDHENSVLYKKHVLEIAQK